MKALKSSVNKTFALLEYFTLQKPEWGVTELAEAIGSNKSTVHRFLSDLHRLNILYKHSSTDKYSLGLKLFELGNRVQLKSAFIDKTHPILVELAGQITETVHLAVWKNLQVFYVDKVEGPQGLTISSRIGSYNPAHATGLGKVLLAFQDESKQVEILDIMKKEGHLTTFTPNTITKTDHLLRELSTIRKNGYALDREEIEVGLICVAIPIYNVDNEVIASLSASGPSSRFKENEVSNYVQVLSQGADKIRNEVGRFKPTIV